MEALKVVTSQTHRALGVIDASTREADEFVSLHKFVSLCWCRIASLCWRRAGGVCWCRAGGVCWYRTAFEAASAQIVVHIAFLTLVYETNGGDGFTLIDDWIAT